MTTTPEQQPEAQAGESPDEAGARARDSLWQVARDWFTLVGIISGFVTVIAAIFAWTILGNSDLVKSSVTIGFAALTAALIGGRKLRKARQLSLVAYFTIASVAVTCICATVVILHWHEREASSPIKILPSKDAVIRSSTTIKFDQRGTAANPIIVACQQAVPVSGHIPDGYEFAVGAVVTGDNTGSAVPVFVPENATVVSHQGNTWLVPVTFGKPSDSGSNFMVYLVAMPAQELDYLVTEGQQTRKIDAYQMLTGSAQIKALQAAADQSWWIAPDLPPSPAFIADRQIYRRSSSKGGCPPN